MQATRLETKNDVKVLELLGVPTFQNRSIA